MLLKGKYFLSRLQSIWFGPVLGFTFSFFIAVQIIQRNKFIMPLGVESALNSSPEVEAYVFS